MKEGTATQSSWICAALLLLSVEASWIGRRHAVAIYENGATFLPNTLTLLMTAHRIFLGALAVDSKDQA